MKRLLCMLLTLVMVLSVPMVGITGTAADTAEAQSVLVDQLSVIGSYADSTEAFAQPDRGVTGVKEIYPSPEGTSVVDPTNFTFLMINLKNYSGQKRADGKDMPLDDNFFYSLRTTLENARKNGVMVGIRFRYDDLGTEKQEPDWDNLVQMFLDIEADGVLEEYADIITWCEIGTLGAFGEQWGSRYSDWGYSDELIDLYLRILPEEIDLLHRSPSKIWHWVNFKLGTSYNANNVQNMANDLNTTYKNVVNKKHDYVSGDGKDFSSGNFVKDDLKRLGIFNDGYMGTPYDYGTYSNRANETAFLNGQADVPYGGEFSGDRYLQLYYGGYNTVWYPQNAIPEMYYTNLAYLHSGVWAERAGEKQDFSTLNDANTFKTRYSFIVDTLGRSELKDTFTVAQTTNSSGATVYRATYTALGYDTLPFTAEVESAVESKNGVTLDLSEYYGLSSKKFIEDHIGYRFIVRDSDMSGTLLPGGTFEYDIDIENTGFFKIDKEKEVELLFVNGGQTHVATLEGVDVRTWDAGVNNLSGSLTLPENISGGAWQVYLRISPVNENAKDDATYCVKFANANIYNETLGANLVGAINVDAEETEVDAFVDTRPTGEYYTDGALASYPADADYLNFMNKSYTFTEDGHYGFTILFKLEGIAEGSEINLTRWETNGSAGQLHSFNYFFKNNATYGYGKTLTANGYYMIYVPFWSVSAKTTASIAGENAIDYFYCNATRTPREDKNTPTSLNGNNAVITPLGFIEGAVTSYSLTLHMPDGTTRKPAGTYAFKNTDRAVTENVQFLQGTAILDRISAYKIAGYTDENGIPYKFVGWTTQQGHREGLVHEDQIALGDLHLYPYYEPDLEGSAAYLNALTKTVMGNVDEDGIVYTLDADTRTALVGTGSAWDGNASFNGADAVLPAYLDVDGVIYKVVGIADNAFAGCAALTNVYIPQTYSDISDTAFAGVSENITVYASAVDADMYADVIGAVEAMGIETVALASEGEYVVVFGSEDGQIWQVAVQSADSDAVYDGEVADLEGDEDYCHYTFKSWSATAPYTADTYVYPVYEGADHVAGDKVYASEGTCGELVEYTISCSACGTLMESGSEVRKNHEYGEYISDGNATCTEDGTKTATCGNCGDTDTIADEGSALGHDYGEYVSDGNATCTEDGTKTATCGNCGDTDTIADEGSALGHDYGEYISDGNATCTEDGTKTATCGNCGDTDTIADEGSAHGHDYEWSVTTAPAPGVPGVNTGVCKHCGDTKTEDIPALPEVLDGDVNGDGALNILDMTLTARYIAQRGAEGTYDLSDCNIDAMDMNDDGAIDQLDLNLIGLAIYNQ